MDMVVSASNLGILPWLVVNWFIYSHESHESHEFFLGDFSLSNSDVPRFFPRFPDLRCQVGNPMTPQRCRDLMHQLHLQAGLDQRRTSESKTGLWRGFFLLTVFRSRTSGSLYLFFLIILSIFFSKNWERTHISVWVSGVLSNIYPPYISWWGTSDSPEYLPLESRIFSGEMRGGMGGSISWWAKVRIDVQGPIHSKNHIL